MRPTRPFRAKSSHVVPVLVVVAFVAGALGLYVHALSVLRANEVPSISVSEVVSTEGGCLSESPYVAFQVTMWNEGFADGVAHVSFYRDGSPLGSEHWAVPGRYPGFQTSVSYAIQDCGHAYTWQLDSVTGL